MRKKPDPQSSPAVMSYRNPFSRQQHPFVYWMILIVLMTAPGTWRMDASTGPRSPIHLGIDVLERDGFTILSGKRVGLLTHPAGVNRRGESTIEILHRSPRVDLVSLFGPEHGIYGDEKAGDPVPDRIDSRTQLPVHSLYGRYRKPTPEMLEGLDALVIDLQDIGVRSYTFISCMRYAIEACFENGVEVILLDRPNPLGGQKVDGPPIDDEWISYVGAFRLPYVHGLTIGELARMAQALPGWLDVSSSVQRNGRLTVIPMEGWSRSMLWTDTGLEWKPTSPNIPDLSSVLGYAMTGLGQQHSGFTHGIGTPYPFRLLRHPARNPHQLKENLEAIGIPGLEFRLVATNTHQNAPIEGVYVMVNDWSRVRPTELSFHMMVLGARWSNSNPYSGLTRSQMEGFNKHVGSGAWWEEIRTRGAQARVDEFVRNWERQAREFAQKSQSFHLYR